MKVLNCSVFTPHPYLRTYYARMYEAKFLTGLIAGCLARGTGEIGYIADYPIYGMLANINAFALGARTVNPQVKIYLEWSKRKGAGAEEFGETAGYFFYLRPGYPAGPAASSRRFGLYPQKGSIREGADADLALVNLDETWVYSAEHSLCKTKCSRYAYEGRSIQAKVTATLVRGTPVWENGQIRAESGYGRFVPSK